MTTTGAFDWVADSYDTYVTTTIDVPFFLDEVAATRGPVLELMCGTGRLSLPLVRAGAELTCVDLSGGMLCQLRRKLDAEGLHAEVAEQDIVRLNLPRRDYPLVLLPFQSYGEIVDPEEQLEALQRIHAHLAPGGRFICTMHNPPVRLRPVDGMLRLLGQFPSGDGGSLLLWSHQIAPDGSLVQATQLYEWYDETGLLTGKRKLDVRFRLVSHDEFRAQIESAGFTVEALYGDYERASFDPATSPVMIWCLRRN